MENIYLAFIALGFILSTCNLLVQSLPLRFLENNSNDVQDEINNKDQGPQKSLENAYSAGQGPWDPRSTVGMQMFPQLFGDGNRRKNHTQSTSSSPTRVRLFNNNRKQNDAGVKDVQAQTEMTVSVPRRISDSKGNWVFDKWGATFGIEDKDTRFKQYHRGTPPTPKFRAPHNFHKLYNPNVDYEELPLVCRDRSTVYNFPKVFEYLTQQIYNRKMFKRYVFMDLRMEIYKDGNSEECHIKTKTNFYDYILCATMRNMRMEYLIPKYPLIQVGAYFLPRNRWAGE